MTLARAPETIDEFLALAPQDGVEATVLAAHRFRVASPPPTEGDRGLYRMDFRMRCR